MGGSETQQECVPRTQSRLWAKAFLHFRGSCPSPTTHHKQNKDKPPTHTCTSAHTHTYMKYTSHPHAGIQYHLPESLGLLLILPSLNLYSASNKPASLECPAVLNRLTSQHPNRERGHDHAAVDALLAVLQPVLVGEKPAWPGRGDLEMSRRALESQTSSDRETKQASKIAHLAILSFIFQSV